MMDQRESMHIPIVREPAQNSAAAGGCITTTASARTFGVAQDDVNASMPDRLSKICQYMYKFGTENMDKLCQSTSGQDVEKLRAHYELTSDVNLEQEDNNVAVATALLQQFLLELPDALIPGKLAQNFLIVMEDTQLNKEAVLKEIKSATSQLPAKNYSILKYILSLMVVISEKSSESRQCCAALATLFGPCIFRKDSLSCELGDKDASENIMSFFISEYSGLFSEEGEQSPQEFWMKKAEFTSTSFEKDRQDLSSYTEYQSERHLSCRDDKDLTRQEADVRERNEKLGESLKGLDTQRLPSGQIEVLSTDITNGRDHLTPCKSIKVLIPPVDLTTFHEHVDEGGCVKMSQQQAGVQIWIDTNHQADDATADAVVLSPRCYTFDKYHGDALDMPVSLVPEAPLSPSANCDIGPFRASLNTDEPPSPPVQQDFYKKCSDDDSSYLLKQINKKIQGLKRKIKNFEESFQQDHGYKPSQGEKLAHPEIRKHMNELSQFRKDLRRLKDDTEKSNRSRHSSSSTSSSGVELSPPVTPSVTVTLAFISHCLEEKRLEAGRPEEVMLMSQEQLVEEKIEIQKALQHMEGLHGQPISSEDRNVLRPLYDRYRSVKRMLSKPLSPCLSMELQTVHEGQILVEVPQSLYRDKVRPPLACQNRDDVGASDIRFATQDLPVFDVSDCPSTQEYQLPADRAGAHDDGGVKDASGDARLHEMSLSELHVEVEASRTQKRRLRRVLREFEMEFFHKHGRKVQKEDRYTLQAEYADYKKVKARLRLLEALILKHHQ